MDGRPSKGIYLELAGCADPAQEQALDRWYTQEYLPSVMESEVFSRAWRYQSVTRDLPDSPPYMTIFETEADDLERAAKQAAQALAGIHAPASRKLVHSVFMKTRGFFVFREPTPGKITGLLAMGSNPKTPGTDGAFNQWYDNVHMADINATGLHRLAHRFEALPGGPDPLQYINLYETELEDVAQAFTGLAEFRPKWVEAGTYYEDRVFLVRGAYRLLGGSSQG